MSQSVSQIQTLTNQYNTILSQYQTTYKKYVDNLNALVAQGVSNVDIDTSPEIQKYQSQLENLNAKLIDINNQIIVIINDNSSNYNADLNANIKEHKVLAQNYGALIQERKVINNVLKRTDSLQQEVDNTDIFTTEYYTRYIILLAITVVLFFLLFKYAILSNHQVGGGFDHSKIKLDIIYLLCVMIVFLGLANIFKNMNLMIFFTIVIVIYLFIKIKLLKY